jgi:hypothetical protein
LFGNIEISGFTLIYKIWSIKSIALHVSVPICPSFVYPSKTKFIEIVFCDGKVSKLLKLISILACEPNVLISFSNVLTSSPDKVTFVESI